MNELVDGAAAAALELWAGFECTLNRVHDSYHDQLSRTGHYDRDDDIGRIAALGVRTVRYPVLWERIERGAPNGRPWAWTDDRMQHIQRLGVDPIVGLMHHGSGPVGTDLLDERFPDRLASFAERVASRYPWVTRFTPINEPLTTARFSALYGIWYPHVRDDHLFLRAILNEVRATRLAMERIRRITPDARLIQTEDLGRTHATAALAGQAAFENERRWLTFDLLAGRVTPAHPLWEYIRWAGITVEEIDHAVGDGCTPDMLGLNYYVTSERWLDERLERYPARAHGGNHHRRYADVEAVRACRDGVAGPAALFGEAWERYRIPMAITEAHIGCSREQQMRWLDEMWKAARTARASGADVRAVTAWAALGAYDWSSLVTRETSEYECGLFDVRYTPPRRTVLATMSRSLATVGYYDHPVLAEAGWWRQPTRFTYQTDIPSAATCVAAGERPAPSRIRPLLLTGMRGVLGDAIAMVCSARGLACVAIDRDDLHQRALARVLDETDAWAVVHAAGGEHMHDLARTCHHRAIPFVAFPMAGLLESARPDTSSHRLGEQLPGALLVLSQYLFGPWDDQNIVTRSLRCVAAGVPVELPDDVIVSPTYLPHLADATLDLLLDGELGVWQLSTARDATPAALVRRVACEAGLDATLVRGVRGMTGGTAIWTGADAARSAVMPPLDEAVRAYLHARPWMRCAGDSSTPQREYALLTA